MIPLVAGPAGLVGKTPDLPEYLPVPSAPQGFAELDAWLSSGFEWALSRSGAAWPRAFEGGAMQGFLFRDRSSAPGQALCGALAPSRDSAGRQFPLALAVPVELGHDLLQEPELLPVFLEGLWSQATAGLSARLCGDLAGAHADLSALARTAAPETSEARDLYARWAIELPLEELWQLLGIPLGQVRDTLRLLFESLRPLRGVERPPTMLSLRLPLGAVGGAALCFWLHLIRRYLGWTATLPSIFWSHDGSAGAALIHPGGAPRATLAELWLPTGTSDEIADLTLPASPGVVEYLAPLPPEVGTALAAAGSVSGFLQSIPVPQASGR